MGAESDSGFTVKFVSRILVFERRMVVSTPGFFFSTPDKRAASDVSKGSSLGSRSVSNGVKMEDNLSEAVRMLVVCDEGKVEKWGWRGSRVRDCEIEEGEEDGE
jgi:hypothetical protein